MKQKRARREELRSKLVGELPDPAEVLRGSLLKRTIRHRRGCRKCAQGGGHPVLVLTVSYGPGKTRQMMVPAEKRRQVERWLGNYREMKEKLKAICEINQELLLQEEG